MYAARCMVRLVCATALGPCGAHRSSTKIAHQPIRHPSLCHTCQHIPCTHLPGLPIHVIAALLILVLNDGTHAGRAWNRVQHTEGVDVSRVLAKTVSTAAATDSQLPYLHAQPQLLLTRPIRYVTNTFNGEDQREAAPEAPASGSRVLTEGLSQQVPCRVAGTTHP